MVPLALAGPLLVPLARPGGPAAGDLVRRGGGARRGRVYAAPRFGTARCCSPARWSLLVLSKVHAITKNGLTMRLRPAAGGADARERAARPHRGGRGDLAAAPLGYRFLKIWGAAGPDLPRGRRLRGLGAAQPAAARAPDTKRLARRARWGAAGRIPDAHGPGDRRRGHACRERLPAVPARVLAVAADAPTYWFAVAGVRRRGGRRSSADVVAPRLPTQTREDSVVIALRSPWPASGRSSRSSLRAAAADRVRVGRWRGDRVRPAGVPEPDAAQRAGREPSGACSCDTRCSSSSRGWPARSYRRCCRSTSGWAS